jgi:hypothetical protein
MSRGTDKTCTCPPLSQPTIVSTMEQAHIFALGKIHPKRNKIHHSKVPAPSTDRMDWSSRIGPRLEPLEKVEVDNSWLKSKSLHDVKKGAHSYCIVVLK